MADMNSKVSNKEHGVTWFVSRHQGAIEWAKRRGLTIDRWTAHLSPADVGAMDTVIGTLPVNLAAQICARGARYMHLAIEMPSEWRGRELTADELDKLSAFISPFRVDQLPRKLTEGTA